MTNPKRGYSDLSKNQVIQQEKLLAKEEKTEKDEELLAYYREKREKFLDPPLSETAKSYLISRYSAERYNKRRAPITAKLPRIAKGTGLEEEALQMLSKLHKIDYCRPAEPIKNDFLHGICDIHCPERNKIVEMKISWSAATFFPYLSGKLPKITWLQTQGYLELYNLDYAQVCYVLVNTPRHLIDQEYANLYKKFTFGEINREKFDDGMEKIEGFYNYNNIPLKKRVITFEVTRSEEIMQRVRKKVGMCRQWLNDFEAVHMGNKNVVTLFEDYAKGRPEDNIESDPENPCESDQGG
jgi:hypothetical protein